MTSSLPRNRRGSAGREVADLANFAGLELDDWQSWCLDHALAEQDDGRWSAFEVAIVVGRQNGKGSVLEARQLGGLFLLGERLQVHTAHEFKTCFEHFLRVVNLIEGCPDLDKRVMRVRRGAGEQAIELRTGERLRFLARSAGSGKGFSGDVVYLDEAFALTPVMMGALLPTLSARANPQVWYTSSAPYAHSVVLHSIRDRGHAEGSDRLFFAEWGLGQDCDIDDRDNWYATNPALGIRISEHFVEAELEAMRAMPSEFARERLGVPDPLPSTAAGPVSVERWSELADGESMAVDGSVRLALDAPPDRKSATFSIAGKRADNLLHVSVREHVRPTQPGDGTLRDRVVGLALALTAGHGTKLILPPNSPAKAWRADLVAAGVELDEMSTAEQAEACGRIVDAVNDGALRHRGQPELNAAVAGLAAKPSGDVEAWSRRTSTSNIAPFVAATCALVRVPTTAPRLVFAY